MNQIVSTQKFHYNNETQCFSSEISDLGKNFNFGQVYQDSADLGFELVSHRTGRLEVMVINDVKYSQGEVIGWVLIPINKNLKFTVMIWND